MPLKKIFIYGINGNMGTRYKAICELLNKEVYGCDENQDGIEYLHKCHGIIVATPTKFHLSHLKDLLRYSMPILCEKPITKKIQDLTDFENNYSDKLPLITMINQYRFLVSPLTTGPSHYNYFKTGGDGLAWDCINIIAMSNERPDLDNKSPVWKCQINGQKLKIEDMDHAYVDNLRHWFHNPEGNWPYIRAAHEKVLNYIRGKND